MKNFEVKYTKNFVYISSLLDEDKKYRVSKYLKSFKDLIERNPEVKLIPLLKYLHTSKYDLESRTTQNRSTGVWIWMKGFLRSPSLPHGSLGGLDPFGSTFSGEFDGDGKPIMNSNCRNNMSKGSLKETKTDKSIEYAERRPKFDADEIEILRKIEEKEQIRKYDLREKMKH
jgi:hypothetical protein